MIQKLGLVIISLGVMAVGAYAANDASDSSSNYANTAAWITGSNGGSGFDTWTITDGDGGHYIGSTGLGSSTFGLFNSFTTTTTEVDRPLTGGPLSPGQTFSVDLGFTNFVTSGAVGLNLRSGTTEELTLFTNGAGDWMLNDGGGGSGGTPFSTGSPANQNTAYHFTLTYNGGESYSFTLTGGPGGSNFTATNTLTNIDNIRFFDFNQGGGANFGFDNLSITTAVPEPGTIISFLSGSTLLGAMMFIRRRRA